LRKSRVNSTDRDLPADVGEAGSHRRKQGSPGALTTDERAELARLRRELRTVEQERDFLKTVGSCAGSRWMARPVGQKLQDE
jgi:transposase-like protein